MMKKFILLTIIVATSSLSSVAQMITINDLFGVVVEKGTGEPIAYVNVGIEGTYIGCQTDNEGFFSFQVPEYEGKTLFITSIGYEPIRIKVSKEMFNKDHKFEIKKTVYSIEDVDISGKSLVLYKLLRDVITESGKNYISKPFSGTAKYTELRDGQSKQLNINISDKTGYGIENRPSAYGNISYKIDKQRAEPKLESLYDAQIELDNLLQMDIMRNPGNIFEIEFLQSYDIIDTEREQYGDKKVWVLNYKLNTPNSYQTSDSYALSYTGTIYIERSTNVVLRNELNVISSNYSQFGHTLITDKSNGKIRYDAVVEYRKSPAGYAANYIQYKRSNLETGESVEATYELETIEFNNPILTTGREYVKLD